MAQKRPVPSERLRTIGGQMVQRFALHRCGMPPNLAEDDTHER